MQSPDKGPSNDNILRAPEEEEGTVFRPLFDLPSNPSEAELRNELQVQRLELELQNNALQKSQAALERSRDRYLDLYEFSPVGYITLTSEGVIDEINLTAVTLLGIERRGLRQCNFATLLIPIHQPHWDHCLQSVQTPHSKASVEVTMVRGDGTLFDAQLDCHHQNGDPVQGPIRLALIDITKRKIDDNKRQLAANVFTQTREGIAVTDASGNILEVNAAFTHITGYSRDEILGKNPRILSSGRQDAAFYTTMWRELLATGHWYGEIWNRHKNGQLYASLQNISVIADESGQPLQYVSMYSDITELKTQQVQLERMAHFDALSNLPNRVLLADRLRQSLIQTGRHGPTLAVIYLDLDGFKSINDEHGHAVGDKMLVAVAHHMKQTLREGDTLARLGGDEFVVVLPDLENQAASTLLLNRLLVAASEPMTIGELTLSVTASLGVTFYPQAQTLDADQLLRQADQAMYQAKLAGKNHYCIFDAEHDSGIRQHLQSQERIRVALEKDEFTLYFQPRVNMGTGQVLAAEALVRWQHPERGLLAPAQFLPVIEDHPLAIKLGEWVIESALAQAEQWRVQGLDLSVSVNVAADQLQHPGFMACLQAQLAAHPALPASRLELVILETSAMRDVAHISQVISSCAALGVRFLLDDFGIGYSSLTYLKRLQVHALIIDQSFVRGMLHDPEDLAILRGVIGLAYAFEREVVAEGVESAAHGRLLLKLGCELAQGDGIAPAMSAQMLPRWFAQWRPDPKWASSLV